MEINIKQKYIPDLLEWNKLIIGINSTALIALLFKTSGTFSDSLKIVAIAFVISLITSLIVQVGIFINPNDNNNNNNSDDNEIKLSKLIIYGITIEWLLFVVGFVSIVVSLFT